MKVIFVDIDGPLIPGRMYYGGGRMMTNDKSAFIYDPISVGMIMRLSENHGTVIVYNSMHNNNGDRVMRHQANINGFGELVHKTECCTRLCAPGLTRLSAIEDWIQRNDPSMTSEDWIVIDDLDIGTDRQVKVDFDLGMTLENFFEAGELFGSPRPSIICARGIQLGTDPTLSTIKGN